MWAKKTNIYTIIYTTRTHTNHEECVDFHLLGVVGVAAEMVVETSSSVNDCAVTERLNDDSTSFTVWRGVASSPHSSSSFCDVTCITLRLCCVPIIISYFNVKSYRSRKLRNICFCKYIRNMNEIRTR